MTIVQAFVLGTVQGLTEFMPVSSSGHLVAVSALFGWPEQPLAFDVFLHLATLMAIFVTLRGDLVRLVTDTVRVLRPDQRAAFWRNRTGNVVRTLVIATMPAVLAGVLVSGQEQHLRRPEVVAIMLVVAGLAMAAAEYCSRGRTAIPCAHGDPQLVALGVGGALVIGIAQACALIPGVSRSGMTISAGLAVGLQRVEAARLSFLLAVPIMLAAAVKEVPELGQANTTHVSGIALAVGFAAAFGWGMLAITMLLRFLARQPLYVFVWYRVALAGVIAWTVVR